MGNKVEGEADGEVLGIAEGRVGFKVGGDTTTGVRVVTGRKLDFTLGTAKAEGW